MKEIQRIEKQREYISKGFRSIKYLIYIFINILGIISLYKVFTFDDTNNIITLQELGYQIFSIIYIILVEITVSDFLTLLYRWCHLSIETNNLSFREYLEDKQIGIYRK